MTIRNDDAPVGADIRAKLDHPIIDGDAHVQECAFAMPDFLKKVAGPAVMKKWEGFRSNRQSAVRTTLWNVPSGKASIDRAMAMLPKLRKERHQEAGIDFAVIYTTLGLGLLNHPDNEYRRATCRALNMMNADLFHEVRDCMTPSALVPAVTPEEAIDELEFSVNELGLKTITIPGEIHIPNPVVAEKAPEIASRVQHIRSLTIDPLNDYDPFWQRCVDLKVSVACHTGSREVGGRRGSPTNFVFNHLGSFAQGSEFFCRSIFMGGVTRRFPTLKFAFLEGGVAWGSQLYNDIIEHWEKRNLDTMYEYLDPSKLNMDLMVDMFKKYGNSYLTPERMAAYKDTHNSRLDEDLNTIDDFKACGIARARDIYDLFVPNFYFGCESDDRLIGVAFDPKFNRFDAKLKACWGSDIGHWDVLDALRVVNETWELVEDGVITKDDFRNFTFTNNVTLHAGMNPDFYKGTVVEAEAAKVMAAENKKTAAA